MPSFVTPPVRAGSSLEPVSGNRLMPIDLFPGRGDNRHEAHESDSLGAESMLRAAVEPGQNAVGAGRLVAATPGVSWMALSVIGRCLRGETTANSRIRVSGGSPATAASWSATL